MMKIIWGGGGGGQNPAEEGQILPLSLPKCISCTILVAMVIHYVHNN